MRLRQIFETKHHKADAAFCFGRFNPAHQGHMKVWEAVKHAGNEWFIGTNPSTIGPNDPLPFNVKTAWMSAIDPSIKGHILGEQSIVTLAAKIYQQVGDGATIAYVTDSQDWAWSGKLLYQYNGKESNHGYFNFANIIHVESPRVTSATELRNAARAGNEKLFYQLAGVDPKLTIAGKTYFQTVAEACGQHPEKVKRAKKEKAVVADENMIDDNETDTRFDPHPHHRQWFPVDDQWPEVVGVDGKMLPAYRKEDVNLIKYANKVIREMRAKEFIAEGDVPYAGKGAEELHHVHIQALKNAMSIPNISMNKANGSPYMQYRFGMAMANPDMPRAGAMSGDPLITAYTDADMQKVKDAAKSVGAGAITHLSDGTSNEADGGNKVSPVRKQTKNKYGI